MDASDKIPGNANLPIGGTRNAIRGNGAPGIPLWRSRGYLPHFECPEVTQHVTFHLADSLAQSALRQLEAELRTVPAGTRDLERRKRVEAWVDAGHGSCFLREPRIAEMVQASLLTFDSQRYRMLAWVVMPNHVHALFQPTNGWTVAKIVAAWKKFTARGICNCLRSSGKEPVGPVWHREYWDRFIRDRTHLMQAIEYIHFNPVKAGLVAAPQEWRWSSAFAGNAVWP